jgi:hypothetical protein
LPAHPPVIVGEDCQRAPVAWQVRLFDEGWEEDVLLPCMVEVSGVQPEEPEEAPEILDIDSPRTIGKGTKRPRDSVDEVVFRAEVVDEAHRNAELDAESWAPVSDGCSNEHRRFA